MGAEPNENDGDACQYHLGDSYRSLMIKEEDFNRSSQATCIHFNTVFKRHLHSGDLKFGLEKNVQTIFVFVTTFEGTPPFREKGHFFWVPKP